MRSIPTGKLLMAWVTGVLLLGCGAKRVAPAVNPAEQPEAAAAASVDAAWVVAHMNGQGEISICHRPPGDPAGLRTITVGPLAVRAHVKLHQDTLGECTVTASRDAAPADRR